MHKYAPSSLVLLLAALLYACGSNESAYDANDGINNFTKEGLENHIRILSSNAFTGRKPFTDGETRTLEYLQNEFKRMELEPGNGNSYLQEVPLVDIRTEAEPEMQVSGKQSFTLTGREDYVLWTPLTDSVVSLSNEELVFAGFGIVAPEYNWNDYKDLDVKGKIVVVFVNDPGFGSTDSTFFKGNTMTYYGRWTYKYEEAARQGAKGCLIVHDDVPAGYGFWVVQNNWNTSKLYLDSRDSESYKCAVQGWISMPTAKKLFEAAGMSYADELAAAHEAAFRGEPMALQVSTAMRTTATYNKSYNAIAKITGTKRPDEYVIYTAHWDHLGIGKADEKGDTIYNGALDNASGTAGLLELADAFRHLETPPERTVVFLSVTAEEQGLLGSTYYAEHPVYPLAKTVADINMDGLNPYGKMKDIVVVGQGQSELEDYLKEAAASQGRYLAPEPNPVAGYYFRSDHFCFAKVGVPALYTHIGVDHFEKGTAYGDSLQEAYTANYYHRPSDEYDASRWNLNGAVDDLKLMFLVGKKLAFESSWPQWKPGSEFKPIRDAYMK